MTFSEIVNSLTQTLENNASHDSISCLLSFLAILGLSTSFLDSTGDNILIKTASKAERLVIHLYRITQFFAWLAVVLLLSHIFISSMFLFLLAWILALLTVIGVFIFIAYCLMKTWFCSSASREDSLFLQLVKKE